MDENDKLSRDSVLALAVATPEIHDDPRVILLMQHLTSAVRQRLAEVRNEDDDVGYYARIGVPIITWH